MKTVFVIVWEYLEDGEDISKEKEFYQFIFDSKDKASNFIKNAIKKYVEFESDFDENFKYEIPYEIKVGKSYPAHHYDMHYNHIKIEEYYLL